ncbi:non-homologous end-joining DNA ligase [Sinorhizobium meliloti]|uniref:non-homologous end-joining DNA ligase n=1 Tax=Rhizobium meliloti TaxID=382 RepID=UPI003D64F816
MTKTPRSKPLLRDTDPPIRSRPRKPRDPMQPQLLLDPMPARVEPCLALLKPKPPHGPKWSYEIKWDGYRGAIHIEPSGIRILTRNGHDWTRRFPAIAEGARSLGVASAIIDGEMVCLDEQGRSDFSLLQKSLGGRGGKRSAADAVFVAFDLLYLDGHDFRNTELSARRHLLEGLISAAGDSAIRFSEDFEGDPDDFFDIACQHGLEGIIAKDRSSVYRSGRLGDWLKIKCIQSDAFLIVGYEPSTSGFGGFGALLLAARKDDDLVYVGSVGTGFKESDAIRLRAMMEKIPWKKKSPPIAYSGKRKAVWLQPTLIAEIEYRGWSTDGKLRHSSYKGLRDRQDNADVCEIEVGDV